ncbi:MAG: pseudouridine synthase [Proteobacteria bacterium]|nr:pseudouridine synthase [Pseudomonadota bacterium]
MEDNNIKPQRIAKVIARSGYCSRREAEELIAEGRVKVNGQTIDTPATLVTDHSIKIDNKLIAQKELARMWIFHKPKGYIVTNRDDKHRKTIFDILPDNLPRVISIGRLDVNTEGLLLLTNDGEVARYIELPKNAWIRNYRARAYGKINMERLQRLEKGVVIDGVKYGSIKVQLEKEGTFNSWLKVSLNEGKNREIKKVFEYCGLQVNRLIRTSFGPFHLGSLAVGAIKEVPKKVIAETLGNKIK